MKEQVAWPSLGANNCNPCLPPLARRQNPCSETVKDESGEVHSTPHCLCKTSALFELTPGWAMPGVSRPERWGRVAGCATRTLYCVDMFQFVEMGEELAASCSPSSVLLLLPSAEYVVRNGGSGVFVRTPAVGPRCILVGEVAGLSAISGLAGRGIGD